MSRTRSYVHRARLNLTNDIDEARLMVCMTRADALELLDISWRTWYRWKASGAPKWATRLLLSQSGDLTRYGWKNWEIRCGVLYCNDFHHRHHWEPYHLILPLYGIDPYQKPADRLSPITPLHPPASVAVGR